MTETWLVATVAFAYLVALFVIARYGDLRRGAGSARLGSLVYPLSLAIYCTTWTFFGSVGLAAASGLSFLSIYIGPIVLMTAGFPLLKKVVSLSKRQRITSVADFLGARYGKSIRVAAVATFIAVVGTVPYIALQLKAVSSSLTTLIPAGTLAIQADFPLLKDLSFLIAVILAVFTILFGTRHADATEHQDGLILAIAVESAVKLAAFLAVGCYITFWLFDGAGDLYRQAAANPRIVDIAGSGIDMANTIVLTILSMLAFLLLPRQFHVAVVENRSERDLENARWLFPLYLLLINLFVVPIAAAGIITFGDTINADSFVLALPQAAGNHLISLIAFIGGLSAGTAMVIAACVALAIMISNHIVLPIYLRGEGYDIRLDRTNMEQRILNIRRTAITVILLLAFAYYKMADNTQALASIGLVSFAAIAQLAPAFFGGIFWRGANSRGAITGMAVGFVIWTYLLLLPTVFPDGSAMGITVFEAGDFLDLDLSPLANGVLWSLAFNTAGFVLGSLSRSARPIEEQQASLFVEYRPGLLGGELSKSGATVNQLQTTIARYLGNERTSRAFDRYWQEAGSKARPDQAADGDLLRFSEELLASAIGASSSRLVLSLLLRRHDKGAATHLDLLDEATEAIQYNYNVLQTAFEQLDEGITVFDQENRLAFWNRQFRRLLNLPASVGRAGIPLSEIAAQIAAKHRSGPADTSFDRLGERLLSQGGAWGLALPRIERILEIRSSPMPGGGIVIAWHDVTERIMVSEALREANETLEKRVEERTSDLVRANQKLEQATKAADQANQSKTRFLAAAGHDLLQPLNAARLYTSTLIEAGSNPKIGKLASNISRSLESVEEILGSVLAISRLESANHTINRTVFPIQRILDQIELEFRPAATEKALDLRVIASSLWVDSDAAYLRRLLQNLVSNAIKYTPGGRVLVGCRRQGRNVLLEVADTGIGIAAEDQQAIFTEFKRLDAGMRAAPGLGLGLSIVERISGLLAHPVILKSELGKGTRFRIELPRARPVSQASQPARGRAGAGMAALGGVRILCIDNDRNILDGMAGLLGQWGCKVITAIDAASAMAAMKEASFRPDVALVDFHLDSGNGIETSQALRQHFGTAFPCILVTANRSPDLKAEAEALGIGLLNKPVRPAALRAILTQALMHAEAAE